MASTSAANKAAKTNSKNSTTGKASSTGSKKQAAVNVKVPTARDRAKDFDEARRNDANSNEL